MTVEHHAYPLTWSCARRWFFRPPASGWCIVAKASLRVPFDASMAPRHSGFALPPLWSAAPDENLFLVLLESHLSVHHRRVTPQSATRESPLTPRSENHILSASPGILLS